MVINKKPSYSEREQLDVPPSPKKMESAQELARKQVQKAKQITSEFKAPKLEDADKNTTAQLKTLNKKADRVLSTFDRALKAKVRYTPEDLAKKSSTAPLEKEHIEALIELEKTRRKQHAKAFDLGEVALLEKRIQKKTKKINDLISGLYISLIKESEGEKNLASDIDSAKEKTIFQITGLHNYLQSEMTPEYGPIINELEKIQKILQKENHGQIRQDLTLLMKKGKTKEAERGKLAA